MASKARVNYDYDADDENQLDIKEGDVLKILDPKPENGWILAELRGKEGYVPEEFIEFIKDEKPPLPTVRRPSTYSQSNGGASGINSMSVKSTSSAGGEGEMPPVPTRGRKKSAAVFNPSQQQDVAGGMRKSSGGRTTRVWDKTAAYNVWAYTLEWTTTILMFLSGVFCIMWSTAQADKSQANINLVFGILQMFVAAFLAAIIGFWRDTLFASSPQGSPLRRSILFFFGSVACFVAQPLGNYVGILMLTTSAVNFYCYSKDAPNINEYDDWYQWMVDALETWDFKTYFFFIFYIFFNVGVYSLGYLQGEDFVTEQFDENNYLLTDDWAITQGFGAMVGANIILMLLFSLFGIQRIIEGHSRDALQSDDTSRCMEGVYKFFVWMFDRDRQLFLHRVFVMGLVFASAGHMGANFFAYLNSGPSRHYIDAFGRESVGTGFVLAILLVVSMAGSTRAIRENNINLFKKTHFLAVAIMFICIIHGKDYINRNYWKYFLGPALLYVADKCLRAGYVAAVEEKN